MKPLLAILHCLHDQINDWIINIFFLSTITFFFFRFCSSKATINSPPSPPKFPIIGNLHQLGSLPHRSLRALSSKYGPLMLLHIGSIPTLVVSSAEMASEVMKTHDQIFSSRPHMSMAKILFYGCNVTFEPYGEYWRQMKKICVIHLLNIKKVQSFRPVREEEVSLMVSKICASSHESNSVNLSDLMIGLTNNIICRVALGRRYQEVEGGASKLQDILNEFSELMGLFPIGDFIPWLAWLDSLSGMNARARKNFKKMDDFLEGVLDEHLQAREDSSHYRNEDRDFVDVLLSLAEKDKRIGRENIKAIILDMFADGTLTTLAPIEWAMAEIIRNPKIFKRVQEEVRGIVGCKGVIMDNDIDQMTYLKAIIKETLRLHPASPLLVPRETIKEIKLEGFQIPMGTTVLVNAWAIGRDPSSWERPEEFLPDRILDSNVDFKGQDFQFIPFGAGRRSCPGAGFAISTIELTLANLLHHFDWYLLKGMEGEILDMREAARMVVRKKSNLILNAKSQGSSSSDPFLLQRH